MRRTRLAAAALASVALAFVQAASSQYPSRPIRIVTSTAPGGAPDIVARVIGEKLAAGLGQPVVTEYRVGSNGNIAAELVARSAPDGHALLLGADSLFVINPHLYSRMPIDPQRDLAPIASLVSNMFVLSVTPSLPVRTFPEFIEYARKADPPLAYASGGNGSQHQFMMEALKQRAGINLIHVPYKGGASATTATVAGEVAAMFAGTSTAPQIRAGRLRALAVTGAKRAEIFPDLPTIGEFYPGYEMTIWLGLFTPAGTPGEVIARLREEVAKALALPDVKEKLANAGGLQAFPTSPEEFADLIRADYEKFGKLVRDIGLKID
ncbi:MAG TPA: tripartite tricarboxylate transporter substrate binding protein [Burkholderiales bacterium]|nr:tripartite tricarboxylate transporter substrate binding protein [Burkholderiales bacterium]